MNFHKFKLIFLLILLSSIEIVGRRGGGGGFGRSGGSRGASAARASSANRGGGGLFGGGSRSSGGGTHSGSGGHQPNFGRTGGGFGSGKSHGSGGIFGSGGGGGGYRTSTFSRGSGIGSHSRGNTFKNMVIGAAAGVLAWEAGKAIIRSASSPMHWNNRNYYWGSQYYPGGGGYSHQTMCRMPIDPSDPQFGNVYLPGGNSRPKEIVWGCGYNEQCCGYECCPAPAGYGGGYGGGGYGGGYGWNSRPGLGLGTIFFLILLCFCGAFIIKRLYDKKRENDAVAEDRDKYQPGNVSYTATVPNNDGGPPPPYPVNNGYLYSSR